MLILQYISGFQLERIKLDTSYTITLNKLHINPATSYQFVYLPQYNKTDFILQLQATNNNQVAAFVCDVDNVATCMRSFYTRSFQPETQIIVDNAIGNYILLIGFGQNCNSTIFNILYRSNNIINTNDSEIQVSVLIPVYNKQNYVKRCLDSVVTQTLQNIEIIIVDDGSTDQSVFEVENYIKNFNKNNRSIQLIKLKENKGLLNARAVGVRASTGKYITLLDSDDSYNNSVILQKAFNIAIQQRFPHIVHFKASQDGIDVKRTANPMTFGYYTRSLSKLSGRTRKMPYMWGKLIDSNIYKQIIEEINSSLDQKVSIYEGFLQNCYLHNVASTYYGMEDVGYNYYNNNDSLTYDKKANIIPRIHALAVIYRQLTNSGFGNNRYCIIQTNSWIVKQLRRLDYKDKQLLEQISQELKQFKYQFALDELNSHTESYVVDKTKQ